MSEDKYFSSSQVPITKGLSCLTTIILSGYNFEITSIAKLPFKSKHVFLTALKNFKSSLFLSILK